MNHFNTTAPNDLSLYSWMAEQSRGSWPLASICPPLPSWWSCRMVRGVMREVSNSTVDLPITFVLVVAWWEMMMKKGSSLQPVPFGWPCTRCCRTFTCDRRWGLLRAVHPSSANTQVVVTLVSQSHWSICTWQFECYRSHPSLSALHSLVIGLQISHGLLSFHCRCWRGPPEKGITTPFSTIEWTQMSPAAAECDLPNWQMFTRGAGEVHCLQWLNHIHWIYSTNLFIFLCCAHCDCYNSL